MQGPDPTTQQDAQALKQELARLRTKLQHSDDRDIREALQMRIQQIQSELPQLEEKAKAAEAVVEVDAEPDAAPATPEQMVLADRLIQQARVEKIRKNVAKATELLREAAQIAPGSPVVLEALADDLVERRQLKQAVAVYKRACRLDPKNVGLEAKFAQTVLQADTLGSLDDQMRMNLSDSPFLTSEDSLARLPYATLLSAFFPGVGHMVLGRTTQGIAILSAWIVCCVWILFMVGDIAKLFAMAGGGATKPNLLVLVPMLIGAAIYLGTLASLKGMKGSVGPKNVERPRPPSEGSNLPFE
jgi:TM2 domain-containing membrane protein YozV